jgi:hypothetical protein
MTEDTEVDRLECFEAAQPWLDLIEDWPVEDASYYYQKLARRYGHEFLMSFVWEGDVIVDYNDERD